MPGGSQETHASGASPEREDAAAMQDRRSGRDRRRTYNRRHDDGEISPPYFDVFDRIASALEHIEELMRVRSVVLPDTGARKPADR